MYRCQPSQKLLCVSPEYYSSIPGGVGTLYTAGCSPLARGVLPPELVYNTPHDVGFAYRTYTWVFYSGVVKLDSPNRWDDATLEMLRFREASREFQSGMEEYERWRANIPDEVPDEKKKGKNAAPITPSSLEAYGLHPKEPPSETDVCPQRWARYSCQFVRLCASPSVANQYPLKTYLKGAGCEWDSSIVPKEWTGATPKNVGYSAGALMQGRRYLKAVNLDSADIIDGDLKDAFQRLSPPITARMYVEYLYGLGEGISDFHDFLTKVRQKSKQTQTR
jgi:hypothetical protein